MPPIRPWSPEELLVTFRLYCRTAFGRLHRFNPEIPKLAKLLDRTPSAIAMKACNFASLDPSLKIRQIKALGNASRSDRALWARFEQDPEKVAAEAEAAYERMATQLDKPAEITLRLPEGPTEIPQMVRVRRDQSFFRAAVLASYDNCCALSGIAVPELLVASHIIPWSSDVRRRADPKNGIALNALYDRAFDRGFIAFDESHRVIVSQRLKSRSVSEFHRFALVAIEGLELKLPKRFAPDPEALGYHRHNIFRGH